MSNSESAALLLSMIYVWVGKRKGNVLTSCSPSLRMLVALLLMLTLSPLLIIPRSLSNATYASDGAKAALTEWTIPTVGGQPTGLALDPSGKCCWFAESAGNKVVHLDPATNTFREWAIPTPDSAPTSLALAMISGSLAVIGTESSKERIFLFFPSTEMFKEYTLPSGLRPQHISIEGNGTAIRAWFNALASNIIGEIVYDPVSATARVYELILPSEACESQRHSGQWDSPECGVGGCVEKET